MNKINYMPIAPINVLQNNKFDGNGIRSHVMILAHLCFNKNYRDFYMNTNKDREFILLDNGAAEHSQINDFQLSEIATHIKPTVVIAPDELFNGKKTIEKSIKFVEYFRTQNKDIKIMGVPHGTTSEEYIETFNYFNESELFDWIGISKFVSVKPYTDRITCLMDIHKNIKIKKSIHMLGCNNPVEIAFAKYFDNIKSIDSCIAYLYKDQEIPLDNSIQKRIDTPEDFFLWNLSDNQINTAWKNIEKIDKLCSF